MKRTIAQNVDGIMAYLTKYEPIRDRVEASLRADLDAARREIADLTSRLDQLEPRLDAVEAEVL